MKTEKEGLAQENEEFLQSCERTYPLTYPQRGVWFLEKINPDTGIGNLSATIKFASIINYEYLNEAVNILLEQNDGFQIRIREDKNGMVSQYFTSYDRYTMDFMDFSQSNREELFKWDRIESKRPFSKYDQKLYYFAYLKIDDQTSGIFMRFHHLITDAWSFIQIANEIIANYNSLSQNREILRTCNPSYRDYIKIEQAYVGSQRYLADKMYWHDVFTTPPTLTALNNHTIDRIGVGAKRKSFTIPAKMTRQIREYCKNNQTSLFALFFAAMSIYINRVKDQDDIIIGTPVLNRSNVREKKTIGMFISTVPLRIKVDNNLSFLEFSRILDKEWFSVLKHQKYPYEHILQDVRDEFPEVKNLYEIVISYQNGVLTRTEAGIAKEMDARWHFSECQKESLILHINERDREKQDQILLNYDYLTDLFCDREIEYIYDHMIRLLWHALDNPNRPISQIHMLSQIEWSKVVNIFNQTDADYPRDASVMSLFEEQVDLDPKAVALTNGSIELTYDQLDQLAESVAIKLREAGASRETIVGLLLRPSVAMIAAILGIIKAGAAYLPIDPDYPMERIQYILKDSRAEYVLFGDLGDSPKDFSGLTINCAEVVGTAIKNYSCGIRIPRSIPVNRPEDLLYVIYTSGSTGRPKGVMIEHRNVVRLLFNDQTPFDFGPQDSWTMFHSYCFDFSVWEMYGALLKGGRLVIVPRMVARDTVRFSKLLSDNHVTILNQTPAAFYNLIDTIIRQEQRGLSLRMVIFGGDALKPQLLRPFRQYYPETRLINMYGITETTVHVTYLELTDDDLQSKVSNIGKPIPTMKVYILDRRLNPLPIGVPGEICVSGDGVGRGYLNNPDLTNTRFIPSPFVEGEILYRSGDLARFFPLGDIEFLGRLDQQVKIRGHRIELGEIESALLNFGLIREAKVTTLEHGGSSKQLIAYYIPTKLFKSQELHNFLSQTLPAYMIPAYLIAIDHMPLTANGKIAMDLLPKPNLEESLKSSYVEPQTERQKQVAEIFSEILEMDRVGLNDNFFSLGGDSLSAVRVVSSLGDSLSFADLYLHPTVGSLAEYLEQSSKTSLTIKYLLNLSGKEAQSHLVVFPFAGGSAASYLDLARSYQSQYGECDILAINLPENRLSQRDQAIALSEEILTYLEGDLYFYSHCAGSSLAIETALILERSGRPINSLMIGASLPPISAAIVTKKSKSDKIFKSVWRQMLRPTDNPWRYLSDKLVLKALNWIGMSENQEDPAFWNKILNTFRIDASQFYDFFSRIQDGSLNIGPNQRLCCPVHCIVGEKDPITIGARFQYKRWEIVAPVGNLEILPSAGHYFLNEKPDDLADWIHACIHHSKN